MHIVVPAPVPPFVVAASAHALHDVHHGRALACYVFTAIPLGGASTSIAAIASLRHFAQDVGLVPSVIFHALWCFLAHRRLAAWTCFTLFYVGVHARRRFGAWMRTAPYTCSIALLSGAAVGFTIRCVGTDFVVGHAMQRLIAAHVIIEEWERFYSTTDV